ncbi:MAG: hypothetical protein K2X93_11330 [Candidatus Obscuribacterales bacterium]|nr:hypothetical protein [Candidatus Obscuribacterales bacterium]
MDSRRISGKPLIAIALGFFMFVNSAEPTRAEKFKASQDKPSARIRDNSGRQIAALSPGLKKDKNLESQGDGFEATISSYRKKLVGELESHNILVEVPEVDVPDNMESTCNECFKAVRTAFVFTQEHSAEFAGWMARYAKQLVSQPKMTPISSPYDHGQRLVEPTTSQSNSKLFYTDEGRLKTVTNR